MKRLIPVLGLVLFLVSPLYGEPPVVHTASGSVRLPGNVPPALSRATRVSGTLAGDTPVTLTIVLNRTDQSGFDAFLRAVQDPSVPNFRHYLSQRELADRFGPTTQAYGAVLEWLQQQGFTLVEGSANRLTIIVRGTRAQTEQAFGVRLNDYRLGDRTFYSNDRGPALPAAIASHVQAVVGLSNLARPVRAHSTYAATQIAQQLRNSRVDDLAFTCWLAWKLTTEWKEAVKEVSQEREFAKNLKLIAQSAGLTLLRYACIADELNMLNLLANKLPLPINLPLGSPFSDEDPPAPGTGQTVGLLEFDNFHPLDVQDFLNLIGQGSQFAQLSQIHVAGGAGAHGADESEVLLDIDAVMSLAPGAQVIVFDGPFSGRGSFQAMFNAMINDGRVTIISNSWAYCEDQTTLADVQSLDNVLANATAAGITVLTGAGDQGSTCLDGSPNTVHVPASSPHITAVGGTSVTHNGGGTYGSEHWWDSSAELVPGGQGGFGLSRFFPRPSYQDGLSTAPIRSVPDVTIAADPATAGYFICQADAGGCPSGLLYGGTSVATPLWAAIVAVLNQQENRQLGFLNPLLYPLAHTTAFHSAAELGSDVVHVGLGTPNVGQLHLALTGGTAGPVDLATSYVSAFPALVVADGTSPAGVAVLLSDTAGNAVSGQSVQLTMNSGSHAVITPLNTVTNTSNGAALFLVTDTVPEIVTFTATYNGSLLATTPRVTFVSPPAAAGGITASPTTVSADGGSTTTITVTLQDAQSNPSPGKVVTIAQGNGSSQIAQTTATTDATGQIKFTATDFVAEAVTYTATDLTDGLPIPGSATVNFVNPSGFCAAFGHVGLGTAAAGYSVTTFASSFPNDCFLNVGPIGLAFDTNGNLLVSDYGNNNLYKFGPQGGIADLAHLLGSFPDCCGRGLAFTKDGRLYAATATGAASTTAVLEADPATGAILRVVADQASQPNLGSPLGLAVDPISGDLFVSNFDGVQRISNFANGPGTLTPYFSSFFTDGLVFGPDGTLYVKSGCCGPFVASVTGTNTPQPGVVTVLAVVPSGDGIALQPNPANPSQPFLYVNRTDGIITKVDRSTSPPTLTDIYTGGSRGDFVTVGPDGCLYATQTDRVIKLTNADGSCSFIPVNPVPQLVLAPQTVSPNPAQGTPATFTAALKNVANPANVPVTFLVAGPNSAVQLVPTDANGSAALIYTGVLTGTDQVVAFANPSGSPLHSNTGAVTWTAGQHTTFLSLNESPSGGTPNTPLTLIATLVDVSATPAMAVNNTTLRFALAGQTCTGTTDNTGTASCTITPAVPAGSYPLTASFAGTSLLLASSASKTVDLVTVAPVQQGFKNGDFCTYSRGAFAGSGVPGQLFDKNFLTTFSSGLTIGDPTDTSPTDTKHDATWTATPTGQSALKTYLTSAAGGANTALTADTTNATSTSGGELPRQTAALTLNLGFDNTSVSGGTDPGLFGDLTLCHLAAGSVIGSWTLSAAQAAALNGKSVSQVLAATNNALGGNGLPTCVTPCGTNCNQGMGQLNQLVTQLNTSFDACVVSSLATAYLCK